MRAIIISNGSIDDYGYYMEKIGTDDYVICADGAIRHCLAIGILPDLWVGDFDSCSHSKLCNAHPELAVLQTHKLNPDKNETDTHIACMLAIEKGYSEIVIWGALGNRVDHMLSNIHLLEFLHENGILATIENEKNTITFFDSVFKPKSKRKYLSLIPLDKTVLISKTEGLLYNLENFSLSREISRGVSNEILGDTAAVYLQSGRMLAVQSDD